MENWREYLNEAAKSVTDLPEGIGITIQWYSDFRGGSWIIYYSDLNNPDAESSIYGEVAIDQQASNGPGCEKVWQVHSEADSGWGPLLYDVAMEWATLHGDGLMPDRGSVSKEARAVWKYYLSNRSDVAFHQMDDLSNTLTPNDDTDNCEQEEDTRNSWYDLEDFTQENPISKRYTKEPTTIRDLKKSGKLTVIK